MRDKGQVERKKQYRELELLIREWQFMFWDEEVAVSKDDKKLFWMTRPMNRKYMQIRRCLRKNFRHERDMRRYFRWLPWRFTIWLLSHWRLEAIVIIFPLLFWLLNEYVLRIHTGVLLGVLPGTGNGFDAIYYFFGTIECIVYLLLLYKKIHMAQDMADALSAISSVAGKKM